MSSRSAQPCLPGIARWRAVRSDARLVCTTPFRHRPNHHVRREPVPGQHGARPPAELDHGELRVLRRRTSRRGRGEARTYHCEGCDQQQAPVTSAVNSRKCGLSGMEVSANQSSSAPGGRPSGYAVRMASSIFSSFMRALSPFSTSKMPMVPRFWDFSSFAPLSSNTPS